MSNVETTTLSCKCGKKIAGQIDAEYPWERMAQLAARHGWLPVVVGEAVGMSTGTHFYACSPEHQSEWLAALK